MNRNIGKELRFIRKYKQLSLRDLEALTGVRYSRLGKIEREEELPTMRIINLIEKGIDVNFNTRFEKIKEIDRMFEDFMDSLFYHDDCIQLFKAKISNFHDVLDVSQKYGKIVLIEYILCILSGEIDQCKNMEEELFKYFENDWLNLTKGYLVL